MSIADNQQLALNSNYMGFTDLLIEADSICIDSEQNYETETTTFTFADNSVSVFNGIDESISTYGCNS